MAAPLAVQVKASCSEGCVYDGDGVSVPDVDVALVAARRACVHRIIKRGIVDV